MQNKKTTPITCIYTKDKLLTNNTSDIFTLEDLELTKQSERFKRLLSSINYYFNCQTHSDLFNHKADCKTVLDFLAFLNVQIKLIKYARLPDIKKQFRLTEPDFLMAYDFGQICLHEIIEKLSIKKLGAKGIASRQAKLAPLHFFIEDEYKILKKSNHKIKAWDASLILKEKLLSRFPQTTLSKSNMQLLIIQWISQINTNGKIGRKRKI